MVGNLTGRVLTHKYRFRDFLVTIPREIKILGHKGNGFHATIGMNN
jgi:hypothetical protein